MKTLRISKQVSTMLTTSIALLLVLSQAFVPQRSVVDAASTGVARPTTTTLVGSLIQPFGGCLLGNDDTDQDDIDLGCLIDACTRLKDVMYMVGQDGNARDLAGNLRKIEQARTKAPKSHRHSLRSLLEYEKEMGVRTWDGRLKNPSAAVGLLWIRRSVAFQRRMNSILLERPDLSTTQAALEAYQEELEPYHSWGLQKIYKMAFRTSTPTRSKILVRFLGEDSSESMDTSEEDRTVRDLRSLVDTWQPLLTRWKSIFESMGLEDLNRA